MLPQHAYPQQRPRRSPSQWCRHRLLVTRWLAGACVACARAGTLPHLICFALELLVPCYERDFEAMGQSDETLARLITVYQHEWPRFQMQFHVLVELIHSRHQFEFEYGHHYCCRCARPRLCAAAPCP